ncbi:FG-GAP-like repeat-containing protein [Nitrospira sp. Ecomares 2.1]
MSTFTLRRKWDKGGQFVTLAFGIIIFLGALPPGAEGQTTTQISVDSNGVQGNFHSQNSAISGNGKIVAFSSLASNLVPGDTNSLLDIFVRNLETRQTTLVSVGSSGMVGNGASGSDDGGVAISANGRYVAFISAATNLTPEADQPLGHVFVHDRQTGETTLVTVDSGGTPIGGVPNSLLSPLAMSANGRYVAFISLLSYVPEDTNMTMDVYVHDRESGQTTRVSGNANGIDEIGFILVGSPSLSEDGRYVAFLSSSSKLVQGDTNASFDIFVHDRNLGQTIRGSLNSQGEEGDGHTGEGSISLSADGRFVAFSSNATNLVEGDTNGVEDVFVRDLDAGTTTRVSVTSAGVEGGGGSRNPRLSADGRIVVFESDAFNLVPPEELNGVTDIFLHNRETSQTSRISMGLHNELGNNFSNSPQISGDGRFVVFESHASNLVEGDTNGDSDVFVQERGASVKRNPVSTDLDGNGTTDLLWRNTKTGSTAIWLLNGDTIGSAGFPGGVPLAWKIAGIGDVDGDGKADVIWRHSTSATVAIWLMNGTAITSVGFPTSVPTAWSLQAVGDVNGDGKADLLWRNSNDGNTAIWLMNGARIAASGFLGKVSLAWQLSGVGDVNGDGKADLIWRNGTSDAVAVWLMNGLTRTSSGFPGNASPDLQIAGVGDVNGDGKADLIWRNTNSGDVAVWLLNGTTLASSGILDRLPSQWQIAQVGDADGDGKTDVIWYDTATGAVVCWLLNGLTIASEAFPGKVSTDWIIAGRPITPPLSITTASTLPAGTVNKSYSITLAKSGGTPSFSWTVFSGSLPPGLTLNPSTGQISGTPTTAGKFLVTIRVRDSGNPSQSAQELFSLTIDQPPSPPPAGDRGTLTIANAPASVGGTFVADAPSTGTSNEGGAVAWRENLTASVTHVEIFGVGLSINTGQVTVLSFSLFNQGQSTVWSCHDGDPSGGCKGATFNRSAGTLTLANTVATDVKASHPPITLNGTLTFPPF